MLSDSLASAGGRRAIATRIDQSLDSARRKYFSLNIAETAAFTTTAEQM